VKSLEKNLKVLEEKRRALNSSMVSLNIGSSSSYGTIKKKDKVKYIIENVVKEDIVFLDDGTIIECSLFHYRIPLVSCVARRFLAGHPAPKKCKRCKVMDKHIDKIYTEILKNEE